MQIKLPHLAQPIHAVLHNKRLKYYKQKYRAYLSHWNPAVHPQRDDFLKGHGREGSFQSGCCTQVDCPHQGNAESFEELSAEQSDSQTNAMDQRGLPWVFDIVQDFINKDSLRGQGDIRM